MRLPSLEAAASDGMVVGRCLSTEQVFHTLEMFMTLIIARSRSACVYERSRYVYECVVVPFAWWLKRLVVFSSVAVALQQTRVDLIMVGRSVEVGRDPRAAASHGHTNMFTKLERGMHVCSFK